MATEAEHIDELTYPHLGTVSRVMHVIGFKTDQSDERTPERAAAIQARLLGLLIARLEAEGVLSESNVGELLLEAAL